MSNLPFTYPDWPAPPRVRALQTTRLGGVSQGGYASLNLADHVGDDLSAVAHNRALLQSYLPNQPRWLNQVHQCHLVNAAQLDRPAEADASFATVSNVVCAVMTADCLPILLCHRVATLVVAIHAGWRGLCNGIIESTIQRIMMTFALEAKDLLAWLGPCIGAQAFVVDDAVRAQFIAVDARASMAFSVFGTQWRADLHALAVQRLLAVGVRAIYGGGLCTYTDSHRFFSFRRDAKTGRMATLIWLT
ncbi:MAG: peptidoglycan editing factor PgeF [Methylophilaceae bacterium]|nr:peptidoglycan editing factor PgeF [Methylophilaceae bacterium]